MEIKILDLTRQYKQIQEEIETAVCEQLRSGIYIGGNAVLDFENNFAQYLGVKHAISVNSGTDALVITLKALGIKEGDEVITTPFSFFATAEAIALTGAKPIFVDIEIDTYNIDPAKIEEKINAKTRAILPVHIFGHPADMEKIMEIAEKYDLYVIEDACQAVGAVCGNRKVGAIGTAACFSFFPTKNLGAYGDGGMITTDDDEIAIICRAYKEHGMAQNGAKARYILNKMDDDIVDLFLSDGLYDPHKYYNYLIGYNSRLDAIQARILNIKLRYLDKYNSKRSEIADFYQKELEDCENIITPKVKIGMLSVWHQYAFRCRKKEDMGKYLASKGISSAAFYPVPLHLQKAFTGLGYKEGDLPVAELIAKQTVCLPIYPELTNEELNYIVKCLKKFFCQERGKSK